MTEVETETTLVALPVCAANPENPKPRPTRMLKMGPAKQAVMAMLAKPFLAMAMLALKSAMEFPQAKMVSPIMDPGIFKTMPTKLRTSTKWSAIKSTQVAAMTNPYKAMGVATNFDRKQ